MKPKSTLVFLIVVASLAGFAALYVYAFYLTATHDDAPVFKEAYVYVANILSGLVGGIVAVGFGQSPPPAETRDMNLLSRNAVGVGNLITDRAPAGAAAKGSSRSREVLGFIYAAVYVLLGFAAILTWVIDTHPPDLVKNLATVSVGLFIPITNAFFKENET